MKNENGKRFLNSAPQQELDKFLGILQRNELDGTSIPIESILPFNIDPKLVFQLRKALIDYQVIAES